MLLLLLSLLLFEVIIHSSTFFHTFIHIFSPVIRKVTHTDCLKYIVVFNITGRYIFLLTVQLYFTESILTNTPAIPTRTSRRPKINSFLIILQCLKEGYISIPMATILATSMLAQTKDIYKYFP